ncbi:MAG: tRNA (adenosine(37)-N6)-threonylcarbamoyltransferase complex dimerization subunit type 1 TsaB [Verrucomicrobia bacterium]|nr:tRNA (adenosine(37)-N6)-threonylcarbamoyltransferase complex dimerization subunit type 1 TsaB [Verrucomicrobiota bacterium]
MTSLAFEFSTDRRTIAIARDGLLLAQSLLERVRETPLAALVDRVLSESGLQPREIDRLVVGLGPGSYTGVRLAISLAQGWHLGLRTEVVGLSSLEALAAASEHLEGRTLLAVDAQRGEYAVARAESGRLMEPPRLCCLDDIKAQMGLGLRVAGPDLGLALPGVVALHPEATWLAVMADQCAPTAPERLAPVYLREAAFVKAPAPRSL